MTDEMTAKVDRAMQDLATIEENMELLRKQRDTAWNHQAALEGQVAQWCQRALDAEDAAKESERRLILATSRITELEDQVDSLTEQQEDPHV